MFGDKLKDLRMDAGLTQEQLAQVIGISSNSISKYESNINEPAYEILIKIAKYFNVSLDYLLSRTNIRTPHYIITEIKENNEGKYFDLIINLLKIHPESLKYIYNLIKYMDDSNKL